MREPFFLRQTAMVILAVFWVPAAAVQAAGAPASAPSQEEQKEPAAGKTAPAEETSAKDGKSGEKKPGTAQEKKKGEAEKPEQAEKEKKKKERKGGTSGAVQTEKSPGSFESSGIEKKYKSSGIKKKYRSGWSFNDRKKDADASGPDPEESGF